MLTYSILAYSRILEPWSCMTTGGTLQILLLLLLLLIVGLTSTEQHIM